ncbi:hypothetical protein G9A89_014489 [Geosiphon pyriformis]|nr:hypothetical protein G9A89_014489 [Geosiphon pyriformis]
MAEKRSSLQNSPRENQSRILIRQGVDGQPIRGRGMNRPWRATAPYGNMQIRNDVSGGQSASERAAFSSEVSQRLGPQINYGPNRGRGNNKSPRRGNNFSWQRAPIRDKTIPVRSSERRDEDEEMEYETVEVDANQSIISSISGIASGSIAISSPFETVVTTPPQNATPDFGPSFGVKTSPFTSLPSDATRNGPSFSGSGNLGSSPALPDLSSMSSVFRSTSLSPFGGQEFPPSKPLDSFIPTSSSPPSNSSRINSSDYVEEFLESFRREYNHTCIRCRAFDFFSAYPAPFHWERLIPSDAEESIEENHWWLKSQDLPSLDPPTPGKTPQSDNRNTSLVVKANNISMVPPTNPSSFSKAPFQPPIFFRTNPFSSPTIPQETIQKQPILQRTFELGTTFNPQKVLRSSLIEEKSPEKPNLFSPGVGMESKIPQLSDLQNPFESSLVPKSDDKSSFSQKRRINEASNESEPMDIDYFSHPENKSIQENGEKTEKIPETFTIKKKIKRPRLKVEETWDYVQVAPDSQYTFKIGHVFLLLSSLYILHMMILNLLIHTLHVKSVVASVDGMSKPVEIFSVLIIPTNKISGLLKCSKKVPQNSYFESSRHEVFLEQIVLLALRDL